MNCFFFANLLTDKTPVKKNIQLCGCVNIM